MTYNFLQRSNINNVMIMVGETLTKMISMQDKGTGKLLGDVGTVAVLGKGEQYGETSFSMNTDGANLNSVIRPVGGACIPSNPETMRLVEPEDGSMRSLEQINMVGDNVFSFAILVYPRISRSCLCLQARKLMR